MKNFEAQKLNQPPSCCEKQCAACKCKVPMIIGGVIFSLVMLVLGIYFGKTYFGSSTPSISVVPTPIVSAPTVQLTATSTAAFANWKTYKNEKYGFEFKYPNSLQYNVSDIVDYEDKVTFDGWIKNLENEIPECNVMGCPSKFTFSVKKQINTDGRKSYYYETSGLAG